MPRRLTHVAPLVGLLALTAAGTVVTGSGAAVGGIPSIYVFYNPDCSFDMTIDGGYTLLPSAGAGPTLPPGTYQLLLTMPYPTEGYSCDLPTFSLSGPGIDSVTPYNGDWLDDDDLMTLQPSATYVAEDQGAPRATSRAFSTAAGGASSSLLPKPGKPRPSTNSTQIDLIGSALPPFRGGLSASIGPSGRATFQHGGRRVVSLKAGAYELRIDDRTARAGASLRRGNRRPVALTTGAFVGRRARRVTLAAGSWTFFSGSGAPVRFKVVS
jgi:hypothetical protein